MTTTATKPRFPRIGELAELIRDIKPQICDDYRESPEDTPSICLTVGWCAESGEWSYQTGDNSYTGGAYHYPTWGVVYVTRRANSRELARDIISQLWEGCE